MQNANALTNVSRQMPDNDKPREDIYKKCTYLLDGFALFARYVLHKSQAVSITAVGFTIVPRVRAGAHT